METNADASAVQNSDDNIGYHNKGVVDLEEIEWEGCLDADQGARERKGAKPESFQSEYLKFLGGEKNET
jgi:hypothetical protein